MCQICRTLNGIRTNFFMWFSLFCIMLKSGFEYRLGSKHFCCCLFLFTFVNEIIGIFVQKLRIKPSERDISSNLACSSLTIRSIFMIKSPHKSLCRARDRQQTPGFPTVFLYKPCFIA